MRIARLVAALAAPLLLASCLLSPGRFVSTLDIRKDRSFTFTYVGEALAAETNMSDGKGGPKKPQPVSAEDAAQYRQVAEALAREQGYRAVEYVGGRTFRVDYQLTGTLDRGFSFPINLDAMALIPWVAAEVRKDGSVRIKAPAFGDMTQGAPGPQAPSNVDGREGTFTLTTDATLVMQNNEEGAAAGPPARVVWKVTPTSKTVPTAVVRF
ncbi:MAG: hypothetical protein JO013_06135 [Alphaproteobacteria bacterium]|nr:hypothetical protein [Alphaproteobacteria bacterium]